MPVVTLWDNGLGGTRICSLIDYPIKALLFESKSNVKVSVEVLAEICSCLQGKNIPYSFLISDCGKRIFLFPQVNCPTVSFQALRVLLSFPFVKLERDLWALLTLVEAWLCSVFSSHQKLSWLMGRLLACPGLKWNWVILNIVDYKYLAFFLKCENWE